MAYRRTPLVKQRLADNRARIAHAARSLIAQGGLRRAQMSEVAGKAGMSTGALYQYFPSRTDLLIEVLREAARLGVPAVWLQPGTFDDAVLAFARGGGEGKGEGESAGYAGHVVAGDGGRGSEGWCVLVDGERALQAAGKL